MGVVPWEYGLGWPRMGKDCTRDNFPASRV